MHTCEDCIFCHYRKARIAAFGAVGSASSAKRLGAGPVQSPPSTPSPVIDSDSVFVNVPQSAVTSDV